MPRLRLVADSNVIISGLHVPGNPRAVLDLADKGAITLYVSAFILREVSTALVGPKFSWSSERVALALLTLPAKTIGLAPNS